MEVMEKVKTLLPISSLREHIGSLVREDSEKTAIIACSPEGEIISKVSYRELLQLMETAAHYLANLGLKKGQRLALTFGNSPELLVLSWAAWSMGVVTVPMDVKRDTLENYQYKLAKSHAKVLLIQKGVVPSFEQEQLAQFIKVIEFSGFTDVPKAKVSWMSNLSHPALVLFTSGTTGHPKGALLSLENLIVNAEDIRRWLNFTAEDTFLVVLPLHHINSTTFCLSTLLAGGTVALPPGYSNSRFWGQVAATGATVTSVVQSIVFDQLQRDREFAVVKDSLKLTRVQIGSAPVLPQSVKEFMRKYGVPVYQGYGQTETALRVTGVPMNLQSDLYKLLIEENSIGEAMPWAEVKIAADDGKFLCEGEEGEILVKGPAVMEGYLGGEPAFRDGYFLTGDIGLYRVIEGRTFYFLKGRKREIIIKGGINISPVAVENSLKKISDDIEQVYVVAVPDERYGEEVGAAIVWKAGVSEEQAKRRLKAALLFGTPHLSAYETPKYITSVSQKELPMTSTGKVQRSILKKTLPYERFESIYGLVKIGKLRFTTLHRYSRWIGESYNIYKNCWSELALGREQYEKDVQKHLVILAVDQKDRLLGQISVIRTSLSSKELLKVKYKELLSPEVLNPAGNALLCISVCSADYRPKPIPFVSSIPSPQKVRSYLEAGQDPVMSFHERSKGGQSRGAKLIDVIPEARPDDKSSLGYCMLLQYPAPEAPFLINPDAPLSHQLIEVVLLLAQDLGISNVFAYSRPGGLASHLALAEKV